MIAMDPIANQLNIETPELVSIEMPVAGIGSRFIAIVIDYLIWLAILILFTIGGAMVGPALYVFGGMSANWAIGVVFLIVFLFHWGYFTLFEAFGNGRTPGKRVAKIRVIHRSGRAISFVESLARNLVRFIDYLPSLYAVGLVVMFLSRQSQRLGDMVAGTLVVRDREIDSPHWGELGSRIITAPAFAAIAPLPAPHLAVVLPVSALARLSTADLQVLEGFFARRLDMDLATRAALAERMARAIRAKSGLEIPEGTSVETFLEAVAHQLREIARMTG
jgi:uncharacterized RDD family membrane protein YckC